MRKQEQININNECMKAIEQFNAYSDSNESRNKKRLDYCTAYTMENDRYYVLQSYNTIVAFIDKENGIMYDVLRYVYGYTATSGKHIAKFRRFPHVKEITYR